MPPPDQRELVFCHQCENEWYRNEHGLTCPNPDCGSDIVEIIEANNDPRHQEDRLPDLLPLHDHDPWHNMNAPDPDEDDISGTTFRSGTQGQGHPPAGPFSSIFSSIFGDMPQEHNHSRNTTTFSSGGTTTVRSGGMTTVSMSWSSGPNGGFRTSRTTIGPNDDLAGIMESFSNMMNHNIHRGAGAPPGMPGMHPLFNILLGGTGHHGDAAYTQEGFDRILTMLREQHGGGGEGVPPASDEAISALPKIKIGKEQLDEQGNAECSICMDTVNLGDEVTKLPCDHWFHGECIKSWLTEHDTCPQCRRGITPRDGDQNQPRTTGQAPRNWNVDESDIHSMFRAPSHDDVPGSSSHSRRRASGSRNSSGLLGGVANMIRRATGGGSSGSNGNNRTGNQDTNQ